MNLFGRPVKPVAGRIRTENVIIPGKPKTKTDPTANRISKPQPSNASRKANLLPSRLNGTAARGSSSSALRVSSPAPSKQINRRRANRANGHSTPMRLEESSDDEEVTTPILSTPRLNSVALLDGKRKLRHTVEFDDKDYKTLIHAATINNVKSNFEPVFGAAEHELSIELQYPGTDRAERYELVKPRNEEVDVIQEIEDVVSAVQSLCIPPEHQAFFEDENNGIKRLLRKAQGRLKRLENAQKRIRQLRRDQQKVAVDLAAYEQLKRESHDNDWFGELHSAIDSYNLKIRTLREDGSIAKALDERHDVPADVVQVIMGQIYDRTVSQGQGIQSLKQYENGTSFIYGELKFPFITRIFAETRLTSDKVFVDLGSGVGNVVLQAALQIGCESWGCEYMKNPRELADMQHREFRSRCRLWGIEPGRVSLEHGDFKENARIHKALKRADVVLVNNQAFQPDLNASLVHMFLDLKDGCKVVSLKPFKMKDSEYAVNDLASNIFVEVKENDWYRTDVSWGAEGGKYYIQTKG